MYRAKLSLSYFKALYLTLAIFLYSFLQDLGEGVIEPNSSKLHQPHRLEKFILVQTLLT